MARGVRCAVKVGRFKWRRAGYAQLMDSAPVQSVVGRKASAVQAAANAMIGEDGYTRTESYNKGEYQGILARGYAVRTRTAHSRYSNAKHKTLKKALGAAKGA